VCVCACVRACTVCACKTALTESELKLLFGGHQDIHTEVQDRMSLGATEVTHSTLTPALASS